MTMDVSTQIRTTISLFAPYGFIKLIHKSNGEISSIHDNVVKQLDRMDAMLRGLSNTVDRELQLRTNNKGTQQNTLLDTLLDIRKNIVGVTKVEHDALQNVVGRGIGHNVINAINLNQSTLSSYEESSVNVVLNKNADSHLVFIKRQLNMWRDDLNGIEINTLGNELNGHMEAITRDLVRYVDVIDDVSGDTKSRGVVDKLMDQLHEMITALNRVNEDIEIMWDELIAISTLIDGYQVSSEQVLKELSHVE